ncbi:MAG: AraC family transcriptional regulator [Pseudomonadota bacterium]
MENISFILRGMVVGTALIIPLILLIQRPKAQLGWATLGLGLAIVSEIVLTLPWAQGSQSGLHFALSLCTALLPLMFAWFVFCIFTDTPLDFRTIPWDIKIVFGLGVCAFLSRMMFKDSPMLETVCQSLAVVTFLGAVAVVLRAGKDDLVNRRRQLRANFVTTLGVVSAILIGIDFFPFADVYALEVGIVKSGTIFVLLAVSAAFLFEPQRDITPKKQATSSGSSGGSDVSDWIIAKIERTMRDGVWAEEGLTIADLADKVGAPEYLVRRTINQRMGFRNFPTFVNSFRIQAAQDLLADPEHSRKSVLEIAYEVGFASLGPFNKAFKDFSEITPTEFRRQAFADHSSISENLH